MRKKIISLLLSSLLSIYCLQGCNNQPVINSRIDAYRDLNSQCAREYFVREAINDIFLENPGIKDKIDKSTIYNAVMKNGQIDIDDSYPPSTPSTKVTNEYRSKVKKIVSSETSKLISGAISKFTSLNFEVNIDNKQKIDKNQIKELKIQSLDGQTLNLNIDKNQLSEADSKITISLTPEQTINLSDGTYKLVLKLQLKDDNTEMEVIDFTDINIDKTKETINLDPIFLNKKDNFVKSATKLITSTQDNYDPRIFQLKISFELDNQQISSMLPYQVRFLVVNSSKNIDGIYLQSNYNINSRSLIQVGNIVTIDTKDIYLGTKESILDNFDVYPVLIPALSKDSISAFLSKFDNEGKDENIKRLKKDVNLLDLEKIDGVILLNAVSIERKR